MTALILTNAGIYGSHEQNVYKLTSAVKPRPLKVLTKSGF